ncbi:hypothetical protein D9611_009910 [Ephemerocybe angulata]|uniref:F-box domain-containing protein n=1 Tax=Ephemerocybe angulata TaxID=980116 RepID=A0A8H5CDL6_9AGAR|nr:hypothetical protein D9611_009910 [Tulosesus angulatus]
MDPQTLRQCVRENLALDPNEQVVAQEKEIKYKDELLSWRGKIEATEILLNALKQKAVVAEHNRSMWSTILAPIRRIPAEILVEIFTLACLGDVFHLFPNIDAKAPISTSHSLIHVCKYWRDTALDIPRIWNHFVVVHPDAFDKRRFHWKHLFGVYGKNLTHIDLHLLEGMLFNRDGSLSRSIFKYQQQYTSLRLQAPTLPLRTQSTGPLPKEYDMPLLEELVFRCRKVYTHDDMNFKAPRLKRLSIYYYDCLNSSKVRFPWNQVTHLFLGCMESTDSDTDPGELAYEHFLPFLKKLVNVTYLGLSSVWMREGYSSTTPTKSRIVLSKLRHLEIQDPHFHLLVRTLDSGTGRDFLDHISAPALAAFDLIFHYHPIFLHYLKWGVFEYVASFLRRTPLLSKLRVVVAKDSGYYYDNPATAGLEDCPMFALSGNAQHFEDLAQTRDDTFTRDAESHPQPFKRWPADVYTMDHLIDRFLEREDPYFQRAEVKEDEEGHGSERTERSEGGEKAVETAIGVRSSKSLKSGTALDVMRGVFKMLGHKHGVADGERKAYFAASVLSN